MYKNFAFAIFVISTYSFIYASDTKKVIEKDTKSTDNKTEVTEREKLKTTSPILLNPAFLSRSPLESMYYNKSKL